MGRCFEQIQYANHPLNLIMMMIHAPAQAKIHDIASLGQMMVIPKSVIIEIGVIDAIH